MGIKERLLHLEDPTIASHYFMAAVAEYDRGFLTARQISTIFSLTVRDETTIDELLTNRRAQSEDGREMLHEYLMLAEFNILDYASVSAFETRFNLT